MDKAILLEMNNIEKIFAHVQALDRVNFQVRRGEVHTLLGENGAGKSTLIKILTGVYPKDGGQIFMEGREVNIASREDAAALGISVIFQELSLIPTLCVYQNIMLGKELSRFGFVQAKKEKKKIADLIEYYGFSLGVNDIVETLSVAQMQMVEILKALAADAKLIIMDEPTASLSSHESKLLFSIIDQLRERGVSIIYISHRLEEVFKLSDRITILRDGKIAGVVEKNQINPSEIIKMMIGKSVSEATASRMLRQSEEETVLSIQHLCCLGAYEDVSLEVKRGEVLVLTGLVGSGRTELIRAIYGADPYDSGKIELEGKPYQPQIKKAVAEGFGLIPEDRRTQGFSPLLSVTGNVALTNYDKISSKGFVSKAREEELGRHAVRLVDLRPPNPNVLAGNLSGGNQQKVVLGKWLTRNLKVLLIDEPTVGIDIGAKDEIYQIIETLSQNGVAVLMVSSDIAEVLRVAHRIIVMREGKIAKEFHTGIVTQEDILMASSGLDTEGEV
ncbi:MAG: sugar ABC transporter ATP-binding protein [Lachnospiraceae bacterium]|nr:sugar ABC transporter ATP-binding protein [Lachnospiraceae bacterium]MDY3222561.1 sugar ABC transporter ATP-binding protein [Lachnospiraceae bacterium]